MAGSVSRRSNPKSRKACKSAHMKWVASHKSKSAAGKRVKVAGSCRKKHNRAMYGSRFSGPFCPGASTYSSDEGSGKICTGSMGKFKINAQGECDDANGCSLAVTGPLCPGVSRGIRDMKDGKRECQIIGGSEPPFIINRNGECVDPNHCASTALALAKAGASMVANAAEDAYAAAKERFKFSCPGAYTENRGVPIDPEWVKKGAVKACKGPDKAIPPMKYLDANGKEMSGKKMRKSKGKMCYMRKSKGKKSRSRVCLDASAVKRLVKGARKGGRNSHK